MIRNHKNPTNSNKKIKKNASHKVLKHNDIYKKKESFMEIFMLEIVIRSI